MVLATGTLLCPGCCWVPQLDGRSHSAPFDPCRAASLPVISVLSLTPISESNLRGGINVMLKGPSGLCGRSMEGWVQISQLGLESGVAKLWE